MDTQNLDANTLKAELVEAFADIPYPGDDLLSFSSDGGEVGKVVAIFSGKNRSDWIERPLQLLCDGGYAQNIFFLSPPAYRYFLQFFLLVCIADEGDADCIPGQVFQTLSRPEDPRDKNNYEERVGRLSSKQLRVVVKTLKFVLMRDGNASTRKEIAAAMSSLEELIAGKVAQ